MNERYRTLIALKGTAIKCLIAFVWEQRQLTVTELETRIGHDKNTVRKALAQLALFGLAGQVISSQETWHLTDKGYQLPLPLNSLPEVTSTSGEKNFHHSTTTTATLTVDLDQDLSSSSSSNTSGEILTTESQAANLAKLHQCGIMGKKASAIASLEWVTPEYIEAHVRRVEADGDKLGLAIVRMECGDPMPEDPEDRSRYIRGKYSDLIVH